LTKLTSFSAIALFDQLSPVEIIAAQLRHVQAVSDKVNANSALSKTYNRP
jgi:hypothetical protein